MSEIPSMVYTIWWIGLGVTLLVLVPVAVALLHSTWRASRNIQIYSGDALEAIHGIAGNTDHIKALDTTIDVAAGMLPTSAQIADKLDTLATILEERAGSTSKSE